MLINLREIQAAHKEWVSKNFGDREPKIDGRIIAQVSGVLGLVSLITKHALKADQGIRGSLMDHSMAMGRAAAELRHFLRNGMHLTDYEAPDKYPENRRIVHCMMGMVEEIGELIVAVNIRNRDAKKDAIGDIIMYLLDLCNVLGYDMQEIIEQTAAHVHKRNWNANPETGEVEEGLYD